MRVGIMQPYFFPYIGYWQLISTVDKFVIYDDVNYIKKGWINRNNILMNEKAKLITLQLYKVSQNKLINEVELLGEVTHNNDLLKTIENSYKKAPYYEEVYKIFEKVIKQDEKNLSKYLGKSIREVCKYLGIETQIILSSEIAKNNELRGQDKIIEICKRLNANQYINPIGGQKLYHMGDFSKDNIQLKFLNSGEIRYKQFRDSFVPNLSIIDVMMFNSVNEIKKMLLEYELL